MSIGRLHALLLPGLTVVLATVLIATSPKPFFYDEPYYLNHVGYLRHYGLSWEMLHEWPGQTGPLFGVFHHLLEPVTHLEPLGSRLASLVLVLLTVVALGAVLRSRGEPRAHSVPLACYLLALPVIWPLAGLALTEMPAMLAATGALFFLSRLQKGQGSAWVGSILGGILLSLAIMGRQIYLPLLLVPAAMAVLGRPRWPFALTVAIAALPCVVVFGAWRGLTPPTVQADSYAGGLRTAVAPLHAVLSYGYAATLAMLVRPGLFWPAQRTGRLLLAGALAGSAALAVLAVQQPYLPAYGLLQNLLPEAATAFLGRAVPFLLCVLAAWFVLAVAYHTLVTPRWRDRLPWALGLGLVLGVPLAIAHVFSTRYVAVAMPLLLVVLAPGWMPTRATLIRGLAGLLVGAALLFQWLHRGDDSYSYRSAVELFYPHLFHGHEERMWGTDGWRLIYADLKGQPEPATTPRLPPLPRR